MELVIDRLSKQFGPRIAVDRVSATLSPGIYGLLGANGAGKTTLMRMLCDVLTPTQGQILFNGTDIRTLGSSYRAQLGYLPQDFGYYPDFTALDYMMYLATLKGLLDRKQSRARCLQLLETVGLADAARRKIRTFSGGMKQRLGIAQAVINNPSVLVLDEPTAGLDPKERVRFRNLIASLAQERIVLLSTHIVSDVEHIADELLVMRSGQFIMNGSPDRIVSQITGKVWECHVSAREADLLANRQCVSNVRYAADGHAVMRIVADERPTPEATHAAPTLEDLYLYVFRDDAALPNAREAAADFPAATTDALPTTVTRR